MNGESLPDDEPFVQELADEPANAAAIRHYATMLLEFYQGKAHVIGLEEDGFSLTFVFRRLNSEIVRLTRPGMSPERERLIMRRIRILVGDEGQPRDA